jgi:hypothetical protein
MHGAIFAELKKYVQSKYGSEAWQNVLSEAGLSNKLYAMTGVYEDQEAAQLVASASKLTGQPASAILEDFGVFIVADLVAIYGVHIKPEWKTLDLLQNVETTIHKVVRTKDPGATPPELVCERVAPNQAVIHYRSARKMCALAKGMAKGFAIHYNERVAVSETTCMLKGDPECLINVRVVS